MGDCGCASSGSCNCGSGCTCSNCPPSKPKSLASHARDDPQSRIALAHDVHARSPVTIWLVVGKEGQHRAVGQRVCQPVGPDVALFQLQLYLQLLLPLLLFNRSVLGRRPVDAAQAHQLKQQTAGVQGDGGGGHDDSPQPPARHDDAVGGDDNATAGAEIPRRRARACQLRQPEDPEARHEHVVEEADGPRKIPQMHQREAGEEHDAREDGKCQAGADEAVAPKRLAKKKEVGGVPGWPMYLVASSPSCSAQGPPTVHWSDCRRPAVTAAWAK
ncbi:hypothetical protein CCM_00636 [Cordyceps militaris CM01]|uniref:Metallothionein n=1 Tax=Cordyceps militaris (strain CM01) TaxID=983644 RepID=G3J568_CORMM|nr:uncharacterized protein CCM_00636 [Cordyceps militaris CM01]EGX95982.1 hypothetical protein CCM_00636 [Cordyceps militaris CM01]